MLTLYQLTVDEPHLTLIFLESLQFFSLLMYGEQDKHVREEQRREEEEEGRGVEGVVCGGAGVIM